VHIEQHLLVTEAIQPPATRRATAHQPPI
jgi:hypothetical protein